MFSAPRVYSWTLIPAVSTHCTWLEVDSEVYAARMVGVKTKKPRKDCAVDTCKNVPGNLRTPSMKIKSLAFHEL